MDRLILRILILASALGTPACLSFDFFDSGNDRIHIEGDDNDVLQPGVKVSLEVYPRTGPPRQGLFERHDPIARDSAAASERGGTRREKIEPVGFEARAARLSDRSAASAEAARAGGQALQNRQSPARSRAFSPGSLSLDFEYSGGIGAEDDKALVAPKFVDYDGTRFSSPEQLEYDYDVHLASVGGRGGPRFFDVLSVEALAGISASALDLVVRDSSDRAGDTGAAIGIHVGTRGTITPHALIDFYGQWALHILGSPGKSRRNTVFIRAAEVGTKLHLTSHVSLFGGWRWLKYEEDIDRGSDLDLDLSGPSFGLLFRF